MNTRTVGVVGAGQMGTGIALITASKGFKLILQDIKMEYCEKAITKIETDLKKRLAAGIITQEQIDWILLNISLTTKMSDMAPCDIIIEAALEDLKIKQRIFTELSNICRTDCILCTNTSSISINEIMRDIKNPERSVGMHFFFPVTKMRLVEIIRGDKTSDETVRDIYEFSTSIEKIAVECKTDTPGFIVNRCLFAFLLEAIQCYERGIATKEDIDTAIKLGLNHPMGPFELMDMSGLDTFIHVTETLKSLPITGWECPDSIIELINKGNTGRKSGRGWYDYK